MVRVVGMPDDHLVLLHPTVYLVLNLLTPPAKGFVLL